MEIQRSLKVITAIFAVVILTVTMALPVNVIAYEATNTDGGVAGNRQETDGAGGQSCIVQGTAAPPWVVDAVDGEPADTNAEVMIGSPQHPSDWSGNAAQTGPANFLGPNFYQIGNGGDLIDGFGFGEDIYGVFSKWGVTNPNVGYTSFALQTNVLVSPATLPTTTLERVPDVVAVGGASVSLSWTSMTLPSVTGYLVYRTTDGATYNNNNGWGPNYGAAGWPYTWQLAGAAAGSQGAYDTGAQTALNTSQASPGSTGSLAYVASPGAGQPMSYTDVAGSGSPDGTYRYALTAVYDVGNGWNIESLYRGAASNSVSKGAVLGDVEDVTMRGTTGIQIFQLPPALGTITTANDLAGSIESLTDVQVLYISDYDNGWKDYLHRASDGTALPAFQTLTDFSLDSDESYVLALRVPGGATDFIWNMAGIGGGSAWDQTNTANLVALDAGWNNAGVFSDQAGNYDTPSTVVGTSGGGAVIDNAAAWVGGAWADYTGPSWDDVQKQEAGGLSQVFNPAGNTNGFFVRCSTAGNWDQGNALV